MVDGTVAADVGACFRQISDRYASSNKMLLDATISKKDY